jgi:hypothetical protein
VVFAGAGRRCGRMHRVSKAPTTHVALWLRRLKRRWERRQSTRAGRWAWATVYLIGFGGWMWAVNAWAADTGRTHLLEGEHTNFANVIAAVTYWPVIQVAWWLTYPADHRRGPFDSGDDDEG